MASSTSGRSSQEDHHVCTPSADPGFDLDSPLLSFNAAAFSVEGEEIPGLGVIPDKIVMGDGLLEYLDYAGFGTSGPDFVHAHEFAHHVRGELGVFDIRRTRPRRPAESR